MKQKWLRTITALAALIFVTLAIAENIYLDIGLSGNPADTKAGYRAIHVAEKLGELGRPVQVGDRIFVNWNDGFSSTYGVRGTGNVNTIYEMTEPVQFLYAGGGESGGGGCGGGSWEPVGSWQPYSASVEGTTVTGWEFVQTGWGWVPQSCN